MILDRPLRIALFTHHFLEPTHHAIASILTTLKGCQFTIYAKCFRDKQWFDIPNVVARHCYVRGPVPSLKASRFDLVHAIYDGKTAFRAGRAARDARLPFLLSFHGGYDTNAKIFDPRYRRPAVRLCEAADSVTVVCNSDVRRLRSIGINREINVLLVPVDTSILPPISKQQENHFAVISRLVPKKGVQTAVRALGLMPKDRFLHIVGEGPLGVEIRKLVDQSGLKDRVRLHGLLPLEETLALLGRSRVLIQASQKGEDGNADGTPQIILWAQTMGVPVVACSSGSIEDIVEDRVSGLLVPPGDAEALALAVGEVTSNRALRQAIVDEARSQTTQHNLERVINQLTKIYEDLATWPHRSVTC